MSVHAAAWLLAALAFVGLAPALAGQTIPVRFEVASVRDTTVTFPLGDARWVRPRAEGIIVDPQRRDALVASLRVVSVNSTEAVAVITGQTTRVTEAHVVILNRRSRAWYAQTAFWAGLVLGAIAGVVATN